MKYVIVNTTTGKLCNYGKRYPKWLAVIIAARYATEVRYCEYSVVHVLDIRIK